MLSIIGSSGSGKTTLLRCLNFLERPDSASSVCAERPCMTAGTLFPCGMRYSEKKDFTSGWWFQSFNLFPQYTALEMLMLAKELLAKEQPDYRHEKRRSMKKSGYWRKNF